MVLRFVVFFALFLQAYARRKVFIISKSQLDLNSKYVVNGSNILVHNRTSAFLNIEFDLVVPVKNVGIHFVLYKYEQRYKTFLLNETVNLCKALKDANKAKLHYFVQKLYTMVTDISNVLTCDFEVSFLDLSFHYHNKI